LNPKNTRTGLLSETSLCQTAELNEKVEVVNLPFATPILKFDFGSNTLTRNPQKHIPDIKNIIIESPSSPPPNTFHRYIIIDVK
jgi:hypothetical protein